MVFWYYIFFYLIESDPVKLGKKLNSQIGNSSPSDISADARSKVWIIVTINILFIIGNIIADCVALIEYLHLPKEIESYINDNSKAFTYLRAVPFTMLAFDLLSFLLFIVVPSIVACCKSTSCTELEFKLSDFLYTLLSSLTCIATHSYHIIFAFINNPYHATSVLLLYIMTLFVVVVIFQKIFYFVLKCFQSCSEDGSKVHVCAYVVMFFFYILAIVGMIVCIGLTIAVLIVLPLNNAIDQASNEIYAIYQASVTVFAALVTFQVFFRQMNSIYTVLIKAYDEYGESREHDKWKNMSEKEKELCLGDAILKHIKFESQVMENRWLDTSSTTTST